MKNKIKISREDFQDGFLKYLHSINIYSGLFEKVNLIEYIKKYFPEATNCIEKEGNILIGFETAHSKDERLIVF